MCVVVGFSFSLKQDWVEGYQERKETEGKYRHDLTKVRIILVFAEISQVKRSRVKSVSISFRSLVEVSKHTGNACMWELSKLLTCYRYRVAVAIALLIGYNWRLFVRAVLFVFENLAQWSHCCTRVRMTEKWSGGVLCVTQVLSKFQHIWISASANLSTVLMNDVTLTAKNPKVFSLN